MTLSYKPLFMTTLILGTLMTISANSWLGMWMGLEINLLSIIPLMNSSSNPLSSEASLKYFITQTMASMFIILTTLMLNFKIMSNNLMMNELTNLMLLSSIFTKMGAAPFHYWFPQVMEGLTWFNSLIMLTWQKLAPMIIMFYLPFSSLIFLIILTSLMVSALMGLNQTSMRKILTYSSINHIAWMLSSILFNEMIWFLYFLIYSITNFTMIMILQKYNIFSLSQMPQMTLKPQFKMLFMLNFFSLGGIPPFIGFLPKWLIVQTLVEEKMHLLAGSLIMLTMLTLFYYMRITMNSFNLLSGKTKSLIKQPFSPKKITMISMYLILSSLPYWTILLNWI
uniref:NADH dehydrogenase subunit 2 n=1 Tax=Sambus femoralis TaxID=2946729 RepID=UPI00207AEC54|nr:NADH dehydrogenase subunit 2 [Sambus femoralis]URN73102.1 NADH dehydrogenase subunit 2 [Sambus femoralis]